MLPAWVNCLLSIQTMSKLHSWELSQSPPTPDISPHHSEATDFHCMLCILATKNSDLCSSSFPTFPWLKPWEIPWAPEHKASLCPLGTAQERLTSAHWITFQRPPRSSSPQPTPAARTGKSWSLVASSTSEMPCRPSMERKFIWRRFSKLAVNAEVTCHSLFDKPFKEGDASPAARPHSVDERWLHNCKVAEACGHLKDGRARCLTRLSP